MGRAGKKYTTYNRVRLFLFIHSYAGHTISYRIRTKYKINIKLETKELQRRYFNKKTIPEISRLSRVLNFDYQLLWQSLILNKNHSLNRHLINKDGMKIYLSIENELVALAMAKQKKSNPFFDPDYENEFAILSVTVERAAGNALCDIENDFVFEQQLTDLRRIYRKWYYKTAYRYKLPTPRILAFLLRLID